MTSTDSSSTTVRHRVAHRAVHRARCSPARSGTHLDARLDFQDIYNADGRRRPGQRVTMSRFTTRFAALFEQGDGAALQARHGIDAATYQQPSTVCCPGLPLTSVSGYARDGVAFQRGLGSAGRPGLASPAWSNVEQYQATFDNLVASGLPPHLRERIRREGRGALRRDLGADGPAWQARHGLSRMSTSGRSTSWPRRGSFRCRSRGIGSTSMCGSPRSGRAATASGRWPSWSDRQPAPEAFDELAAGFRHDGVSGYSDTGIARYARLAPEPAAFQARHGLDAVGYQRAFDELPHRASDRQVSGYGDGFYPA